MLVYCGKSKESDHFDVKFHRGDFTNFMDSLQSLALLLWNLISDVQSGLYVEMRFLEITFRRGQALFGFCIFALDYRNVIKPLIKWYEFLIQ